MADFVAHGLLSSAVCGSMMAKYTTKKYLIRTTSIISFTAGIAPDAIDWIAATFFNSPRWEIYNRLHIGGDITPYFAWFIPYILHPAIDLFFHMTTSWGFWQWMVEAFMWIYGLTTTLDFFLNKRDEV